MHYSKIFWWVALKLIMYSNNEATLTLYKNSSRSVCKDYVIRLNEEQESIEKIISISSDIVKQLIDSSEQHDQHEQVLRAT